jgi:hypothetical protein
MSAISHCTKEEFTRSNTKSTVAVEPVKIEEIAGCARYSPPPLDILLLVDNSSSQNFFTGSLSSLVSSIIQKSLPFRDYRIYIAPLIAPDNETEAQKQSYQLVSNDCRPGENVGPLVLCAPPSALQMPSVNTSTPGELGFRRVQSLLVANSSQNSLNPKPVFRDKSYKLVMVLSNGDDTDKSFDGSGNTLDTGQFESYFNSFIGFKNVTQTLQFRFISVVNFQQCGSVVKQPGLRYQEMSKRLYQAQGINDTPGAYPDSYDLCSNDLATLFRRVAGTIDNFKVGHTYNYWPIGSMNGVDPTKLEAIKSPSGQKLTYGDTQNGFQYVGYQTNRNIRESPVESNLIPKEIYNDHFIQLFGNGKVTFPECLVVRKAGYAKYYGFIVIPDEPDLNFLVVKINGQEISPGAPNGWEYIGYKSSTNVLVKSPTNLTPVLPGIFKTGYVIKLYGNAIYQDGASIEVVYKKAKP